MESDYGLDREVAKEILGWEDWREDGRQPVVKPPGQDSRVFRPSIDMSDAWLLVDATLEKVRGMFRLVRHGAIARTCTAVFYFKHNNEIYETGSAVETTEPLAICKAALAAMLSARSAERLCKYEGEDFEDGLREISLKPDPK